MTPKTAAPRVTSVGAASDALAEGIAAFNAGRAAEAAALFEAAVARSPREASARLFLAHALRACGRERDALPHLLAAARLSPAAPGAWLGAAEGLRLGGKPLEALRHALRAAALDASCWTAPETHAAFAAAREAPRVARAALPLCAKALAAAPAPEAWSLCAELAEAAGDAARAQQWISEAAARDGATADALLKAAARARDAARWSDCLDLARRAGQVDGGGAARELEAEALAGLGRPEEARAAALALVAAAPRSAEARLKGAWLLYRLGDARAAFEQARKACSLGGGSQAREACASFASALGKPAEAAKLLAGEPPSLALARALAESGKPDQALRAVRGVLAREPRNSEAWRRLAEFELALGRREEALSALSKGRAEAPEALADAAALLARLDMPAEALELCARARKLAGASPSELRARYAAALAYGRRSVAVDALREAERGFASDERLMVWAAASWRALGRFDDAARAARLACEAGPRSAAAWSEAALLETWSGRAEQALALADEALAAEPGHGAALRARGAALALQGKLDEAREALSAAVAALPGDAEARVWLAEVLRLSGDPDESLAELDRLFAALPEAERPLAAWANRALARLALGESVPSAEWDRLFAGAPWRQLAIDVTDWPRPGALVELLRALRGNRGLTPTFVWAKDAALPRPPLRLQTRVSFMRAQASLRFGDAAAALRELDFLLAEDRSDPYAWASRGEALLWLGRYADARRDLEKAARLGPALPWPRVGLAACALLTGDLARADKELSAALENGASQGTAGVWRAELLRARGEPEAAIKALAGGKTAFPFRPGLWLNLALAHFEARQPAKGAALYKKLRKAYPDLVAAAPRGKERAALAAALASLRGNRSSWFAGFFDARGRLRHARIHGLTAAQVPAAFRNSPWMFAGG